MQIAIIAANNSPIPATRGGATENMMTHLIEVNEEVEWHKFTIFSFYDEKAEVESKKYKNTFFHFYKPHMLWDHFYLLVFRLLRKITGERIYLRSNFVKYSAKIINKGDFDVVILEGNCFQLQQFRSLIKNKIILHMHIDRLNKELKSAQKMLDVSDGVFAISEFCKNRMTEVDPSCEEKVIVVKNTIDTEKFICKDKSVKNRIREKLGVTAGQKVISYCGRIDPTKGVLELVQAVKLLNDENLRLIIIGSSVYEGSKKSEYFVKTEHEATTLKGGCVFTGYIAQQELPEYISTSDIAIVPSLCQEAAGNVTIEALACGVPVIASSQGGIPEYADEKACRMVNVDGRFVENLAKQIHELAYDHKLYLSLKSCTREVALQYDKHNYYVNFCAGIEKILNL